MQVVEFDDGKYGVRFFNWNVFSSVCGYWYIGKMKESGDYCIARLRLVASGKYGNYFYNSESEALNAATEYLDKKKVKIKVKRVVV